MDDFIDKLLPGFFDDEDEFIRSEKNFIHYTSGHVAKSILTEGKMWMRNTRVMNDISEGKYSIELLNRYLKDNTQKFTKIQKKYEIEQYGIEDVLDEISKKISKDTYITCFSEYCEKKERIGRLSMWSIYGKKEGAAGVVLNANKMNFSSPDENLTLLSIRYLNQSDFNKRIDKIFEVLINQDVTTIDKNIAYEKMVHVFIYLILSTKHPSFKEEREWRLVYNPLFSNPEYVEEDVEVVNDVLQPVIKIKINELPNEATLDELIRYVIIGPSNYSEIIKLGITTLLKNEKITNAEERVIISNIPLRV